MLLCSDSHGGDLSWNIHHCQKLHDSVGFVRPGGKAEQASYVERHLHTRHGLHFNKKGKRWLAQEICEVAGISAVGGGDVQHQISPDRLVTPSYLGSPPAADSVRPAPDNLLLSVRGLPAPGSLLPSNDPLVPGGSPAPITSGNGIPTNQGLRGKDLITVPNAGFKVVHINLQSIRNKLEDFTLLLHEHDFDVALVSTINYCWGNYCLVDYGLSMGIFSTGYLHTRYPCTSLKATSGLLPNADLNNTMVVLPCWLRKNLCWVVCDKFNDYFVSVGESVAKDGPSGSGSSVKHSHIDYMNNVNEITFNPYAR
ncbi:hypothetical protein J6590_079914 [Homalodisca vitripennis]|nr:hypothetical protein J6590_079914 [Homalodisca vitripennis]